MPYGGINTTVNADLIQTDVDGIIQGLTGVNGSTLSSLQDGMSSIERFLSGYNTGPMTDVLFVASAIRDYLSGSAGPLADISGATAASRDYLSGSWGSPLTTIRDYVTSYVGGPLTDAASAASVARDYLSGIYNGPLTAIRDYLGGYMGGPLMETYMHVYGIRDLLSGTTGGPITVTTGYAFNILNLLSGEADGPVKSTSLAVAAMRDFMEGITPSPLTGIDANVGDLKTAFLAMRAEDLSALQASCTDMDAFLGGDQEGPLTVMRDQLLAISGRLWNETGSLSAADLLAQVLTQMTAIKAKTDQFTFDGNGRLLVATA